VTPHDDLAVLVVGVDPGPTTGIAGLLVRPEAVVHFDLLQCTAGAAGWALEALLAYMDPGRHARMPVVAIERFVARGRLSGPQEETTRLAKQLMAVAHGYASVVHRSAGQVKPWATDARLTEAGLMEAARGMRHARDAARHALYEAVHSGHLRDPLEGTL
jgi:hypothetical protein